MGLGGIFCAGIVISSPILHSARIGMTGHCAGPIKFARGLARSPALRRSSRLGLRACTAELTSAFNPLCWMPKYWRTSGSLFCWRVSSVLIGGPSAGPLVDRGRNSGDELDGERYHTSPVAGWQLRIRALQCTPARGAVATHGLAVGRRQ